MISLYDIVHLVHLYSVFIYGGFLFVDNLFLAKMSRQLTEEESAKSREAIMIHVRKVVPYALFTAVVTGAYMFVEVFGKIEGGMLSSFQAVLALKAFIGLWLGLRGFNQKLFGINPFLFKGHRFPFYSVIVIIFLSQAMHYS